MAQSRPPPSRLHTTPSSTAHHTAASPPLSPRSNHHSEKKHHSRRKSGRTEYTSSDKKSRSSSHTRSSAGRKSTPQYVQKVESKSSRGHAQAQREREERDEDRGRDSGESFPQFCMSCEKQFLPTNSSFLYCSESCRLHDLNPNPIAPLRTTSFPGLHPQSTSYSHSPPITPYTLHFPTSTSASTDGPDIIPPFSPTQSRPRSYFSSESYPSSYQAPSTTPSASIPHPRSKQADSQPPPRKSSSRSSKQSHNTSSALESLREIAGALPKSDRKPRKPSRDEHSYSSDENTSSSIKRNPSAVWNYIPFTTSSVSHTTTPVLSYSQSSTHSYGNGSSGEDLHQPVSSYSHATGNAGGVSYGGVSYGAVSYANYGSTGGMGMDRPLPPRGPGHRPKSIDLVTPYGGGH